MKTIKTYSQFLNEGRTRSKMSPRVENIDYQKETIKHKKWYDIAKKYIYPIEEWEDWLNLYGVKNYTINYDTKTVDVDGDVDLEAKGYLKVQFGKVSGNFSWFNKQAESLIGCPSYVGKDFSVSRNRIKYTTGGPKYVGGSYFITYNRVQNIITDGLPEYVGGALDFGVNNLQSLKGFPKKIVGKCDFHDNALISLEGCPESPDVRASYNYLTSLVFSPDKKVTFYNNPCEYYYKKLGFTIEAHIESLKNIDPNPQDTIQRLKKYNPSLAKELSLEFGLESEELTDAYNTSKNVEGDFY